MPRNVKTARFATLWWRVAAMLTFVAAGAVAVLALQQAVPAAQLVVFAAALLLGMAVLAAVAAMVVMRSVTLPLRRLTAAIEEFRATGFARPIRLPDRSGSDDIARLMGDFQEMSERIAIQVSQLEQVDRQRRELLANVSHDLRTPLASMQGYLETMLIRVEALSTEERCHYLQIAVKHCERLAKLVRDLFDLTKLEANEVKPQVEIFPLTELVQDVIQKFTLSAQKRGLDLCADFDAHCPSVCADIGMIERVMENLIENAMRYTPKGGRISVSVRAVGARIELQVRDSGVGIREEEIKNLFDRYYRVDRGESSDAGNAGLGLAIVRRIVELHGGQICVDSELGRGTRFVIDLAAAA